MTRFSDRFTGARAKLLEKFGQTVTYTAYGSSAADITASFLQTPGEDSEFHDGKWILLRGTLECSSVDASSPDERDQFTISGVEWEVDGPADSNSGMVSFTLVRKVRREVSGEAHRIPR